jgi:bacterioferritin-associated ferredoxin
MRSIRIYNAYSTTPSDRSAMIVCVCRRVSDRELARHARAGMSFDDIQFELGVATQCGQCECCARDVVAQCNPCHPVAAVAGEMRGHRIQLAASITDSAAWAGTPGLAAG